MLSRECCFGVHYHHHHHHHRRRRRRHRRCRHIIVISSSSSSINISPSARQGLQGRYPTPILIQLCPKSKLAGFAEDPPGNTINLIRQPSGSKDTEQESGDEDKRVVKLPRRGFGCAWGCGGGVGVHMRIIWKYYKLPKTCRHTQVDSLATSYGQLREAIQDHWQVDCSIVSADHNRDASSASWNYGGV